MICRKAARFSVRRGIRAWLTEYLPELYGLAGLEPWIYNEKEEYIYSSSAKLIGERI